MAQDGRLIVAELRVRHASYRVDPSWWEVGDGDPPLQQFINEELPSAGLTARDLRRVRPSEATARIWQSVVSPFAFPGLSRRRLAGEKPSPLRRHKSDDEYARIAFRYLRVLERDPLRVLEAMREEYAKDGAIYETKTIRNWVRRARERGFLSPGTRGRAGAEPTAKLQAWLAQREPKRRRG